MSSRVVTPAQSRLVLLMLVVTLVCSAMAVWTTIPGFDWAARGAFLILCLFGMRFFSIREASLAGFALASGALSWWMTGSTEATLSGLDLAAFFGAFIAALTAMCDIAARSRSILAVGSYLIRQPAGRRYYATAIGGHMLGVFLNFGAISLMAPLIQKSTVDEAGNTDTVLERRQLSALIRGFAWVLVWAPTMLAQAVLLSIFTDVTWIEFGPMGILTAILFIFLGRIYDRWEWPSVPRSSSEAPPIAPQLAIATVVGICASLIGATFATAGISGMSIAQCLMVVTPFATVVWFLAQESRTEGRLALDKLSAVVGILSPSAIGLARSAVALGLSGFIGRTLGRSLPTEAVSSVLDLSQMPGWLFLAILPLIITLGGQIALSPILLVVLLGEILRGVDVLPTGNMQIVYALSVGWALSMMAAPNATATLLISGVTRIPPTTLTWIWNLRFGLLCYGASLLIFALIA